VSKALSPWFGLSLCTLGYLYATSNRALAQVTQVTSDGTTGTTVSTQVTPNGNVAKITGGEPRGGNLFHSFRDFSVGTGETASFLNANDIANIFSRVTGGNISNIDGLIKANGSANLFLINPAGILFGENARLDVGGSFLGSTADSILFEDGEFSAVNNLNQPILTINAPIGLGFRDNPAPIQNNSTASADFNSLPSFDDGKFGLRVPDGKTFALAGGDITANGGGIVAFGGRIEIAAVGGEGTLGLTSNGDDFSFSFPDNLPRADVTLTNQADFLVAAGGGGDIAINARNIDIKNKSSLNAGILSNLGSTNSQAGNIFINATGNIDIIGSSAIVNPVFVNGIGNSGNIDIIAKSLTMKDDSVIRANTFSRGNAGDIIIDVKEAIELDNGSRIASVVTGPAINEQFGIGTEEFAIGNAGNIKIQTGSLLLKNSNFNANTYGQGDAGNIFIQANESISLEESLISSTVGNGAIGNGGDIDIQARSLSLFGGSQVQAAVFRQEDNSLIPGGVGDGGDIRITTTDFINISGVDADSFSSSILTITEQGAEGQAGDITVDTNIFRVSNSGNINSATRNSSNGGNITIKANTFEATSGGQVRATTRSDGKAGNITLNISDKVIISGSDPTFFQRLAQFDKNFVSDAGAASGLFVNSTPESTGQAGSLSLNAKSLVLSDQGTILASTQSGVGGDINLQVAEDITLQGNSFISAQASGDADGGNLTIDARFIVASFSNGNGNDLVATADRGTGGQINLNAEQIFGLATGEAINDEGNFIRNNNNDLDASSKVLGLDGTVNINTVGINPIQGTVQLPANIVEPEQTTEQVCEADRETAAKNGLIVNGKGGIPAPPDQPLTSQNLLINGEVTSASAIPEPIETSQGKIHLARGIKFTKDGGIILTPYPTNNAGERIPEIKPNCI
jgi:filamentous hemagglutinin family protein